MNVKYLGTFAVTIAFSTYAFAALANDSNYNQNPNWTPPQPTSDYWQTPNWSNFNMSQGDNSAPPGYAQRPPMTNNNYRQPVAQNYNQSRPNDYPAPNMNQNNMNRYAPPPPPQNGYRGNPFPPQQGPNSGPNMNQYRGPDNGASAYNMPGYRQYRNNNGWNNNKFWGNSGPNRWMNPNKGNMEQGWDDMINAPSRMGEMPGGWNAPEVSMPNPIDMGDQIQDNVKDLPDQIKNMDVGN